MNETALTLQEAAKVLNLSYSTIFARRHEIGFRIPGSRLWRVWPATLANLSNRSKLVPLSLRVVGVNECQSTNIPKVAPGGWISRHQTVKELDALLAQPTKRLRKNSTTS